MVLWGRHVGKLYANRNMKIRVWSRVKPSVGSWPTDQPVDGLAAAREYG